MRAFVILAIIVWLLCGFAGEWMAGSTRIHWQKVARGPLTLVEAFNEAPRNYPGPQ